jgi:ribonucleoside-diphosphate reductase alpha chain
MYLHAWKQGLKTTYYLRSRPATRIASTTASDPSPAGSPSVPPSPADDGSAVACSLESPETCEACD